MTTELELLQTSISHFKKKIKELQTDHQWCQKMNEIIDNNYISKSEMNEIIDNNYIQIPRIDLNKSIKMHLKMKNVQNSNRKEFSYIDYVYFKKITSETSETLHSHEMIIFAINDSTRLIFVAGYIANASTNINLSKSNLKCKINGGTETYLHCMESLSEYDCYYAIINCNYFIDTDFNSMTTYIYESSLSNLRIRNPIIEIGLSENITFNEQYFNKIFYGSNTNTLQELVTNTSNEYEFATFQFYISSLSSYDLKMFILPE